MRFQSGSLGRREYQTQQNEPPELCKAAEETADIFLRVGCLQQPLHQGSNPFREIEYVNEL